MQGTTLRRSFPLAAPRRCEMISLRRPPPCQRALEASQARGGLLGEQIKILRSKLPIGGFGVLFELRQVLHTCKHARHLGMIQNPAQRDGRGASSRALANLFERFNELLLLFLSLA